MTNESCKVTQWRDLEHMRLRVSHGTIRLYFLHCFSRERQLASHGNMEDITICKEGNGFKDCTARRTESHVYLCASKYILE